MPYSLRGLYAITDRQLIPDDRLTDMVEQAIKGGTRVVQYRDKSADEQRRYAQAMALNQLCQHYQIPLLINDDVRLAQRVGAAGVHLGKEDISLTSARSLLGAEAVIGVSCYNQLTLAQQAIACGANYIAFGRFFDSQIKPSAVVATTDLLRSARQQFSCPIIAIGGITPENGVSLITAGADGLAVIHGLFGQSDITATATRYAQLFDR
jgi:thiamine-phosphate pyrophosphorylase